MRLDPDVKAMSPGEARQEIMRLRRAVRHHRNLEENARCWHADLELYATALPEAISPGKMLGHPKRLLAKCRRYIARQQCGRECPNLQRPRT